jgi:hypothetical protein
MSALGPSGRARARRLDQALDRDRADRRPDRNRDRAGRLDPSHRNPGSLPNASNGRVAPAQPNQHRPSAPAPAPAGRRPVSPGAPPAPPNYATPTAGPGGGEVGQGAAP